MSPTRGNTSRRLLLASMFVTTGAWAETAPVQMSRADAKYQDTPRGGLSCAGCTFFRRPRSCQVVAGDISPTGWCRLFDLPD
jgi:hypothetical protein